MTLSKFQDVALIPIEKDDGTHKPRGGELVSKSNQTLKINHPLDKIFC